MRLQEESGYQWDDYYLDGIQDNGDPGAVSETCRQQLGEWFYRVIDHWDMKRETVAVAMSTFDRFLASPAGRTPLRDPKIHRLVAMASLYNSIKIHEALAVSPGEVARMSQGLFSTRDVTDMEMKVLQGVGWRVHPPTALAFVHRCLELLPEGSASPLDKATILGVARYQTEVAVMDYALSRMNASTVAVASVANSMFWKGVPTETRAKYLVRMVQLLRVHPKDYHTTQIMLCKAMKRLKLERRNDFSVAASQVATVDVKFGKKSSPRCVANGPLTTTTTTTTTCRVHHVNKSVY